MYAEQERHFPRLKTPQATNCLMLERAYAEAQNESGHRRAGRAKRGPPIEAICFAQFFLPTWTSSMTLIRAPDAVAGHGSGESQECQLKLRCTKGPDLSDSEDYLVALDVSDESSPVEGQVRCVSIRACIDGWVLNKATPRRSPWYTRPMSETRTKPVRARTFHPDDQEALLEETILEWRELGAAAWKAIYDMLGWWFAARGLDPETQRVDRTHIELHPVPWVTTETNTGASDFVPSSEMARARAAQ
jgi:hypothetical protein